MYREMRRKDRETMKEDAVRLLEKADYGILATISEDGSPYAVPLDYVFSEGSIYFHCATEGHKLDNIKSNPEVSFCVVGDTKVLPDKLSTRYESAIAFGKASVLTDRQEKISAFKALIGKYSPNFKKEGDECIDKNVDKTCIVEIKIEHLTSKKGHE